MPMDPATATLLGSLATNAANFVMGERQNRFTRQMSSTAHQRQAEDLRRAGINPLLGAGGVGASTPVGSQVRFEDSISKSVTSGLAAKLQKAQLDALYAETQNKTMDSQVKAWQMDREQQMLAPMIGEIKSRTALHQMDTDTKRRVLSLVAQQMSAAIARDLASALNSKEAAAQANAHTILLRLQERGARNMSDAQRSWWMREVAPYLSSAKDVAGVAGSVAGGAIAGGVAGGAVKAVGRTARSLKALRPDPFGKADKGRFNIPRR